VGACLGSHEKPQAKKISEFTEGNGMDAEKTVRQSEAARQVGIPDSSFRDLVASGFFHDDCIQKLPNGGIRIRLKQIAKHHPGMLTSKQLKVFTQFARITGLPQSSEK